MFNSLRVFAFEKSNAHAPTAADTYCTYKMKRKNKSQTKGAEFPYFYKHALEYVHNYNAHVKNEGGRSHTWPDHQPVFFNRRRKTNKDKMQQCRDV